jgi:CDC-like kinase
VVSSTSTKALVPPPVRPPINDDRDGHLIYQAGDLVQNRCMQFSRLHLNIFHVYWIADEIVRTLGEGTFGKVVQVTDRERGGHQLALKIIKKGVNRCGFSLAIQLLDYFDFYGHMCLVFDLLGLSVFDFMVGPFFHSFNL